jgi:hypothetical protein
MEGRGRFVAYYGGLTNKSGVEGRSCRDLPRAARKLLTRGKGEGLSQLAVCFQGIAVGKERVGAVASCHKVAEMRAGGRAITS